MKMVKSLLLGSAAGLMAVAGAQAADMAVKEKVKPVEYVKICTGYGAGFYFLPGTDICVKIGGYVRAQYYANTGTAVSAGPFYQASSGNQNTRAFGGPNDFVMRARTILTMDTRAPTEWGVVRTYMNIGWTVDSNTFAPAIAGGGLATGSPASTLYTNRAFIQWAGFTFGRAQSFWDLSVVPSFTYFLNYTPDTGDAGQLVAAYTTQWGNGISSTISIEDPRRFAIVNTEQTLATSFIGPATNFNNDMANVRWPDIVSNIRIDQAWGTFQFMSALHDASAAYYFAPCGAPGTTIVGAQNCGYPEDKWGWAVGAGVNLNLPFIAKGDRFTFQVNFSEGAVRYVNNSNGTGSPSYFGGAYSLGLGFMADAVLRDNIPGVQAGSLELTKAWGFFAAYEHLWTPYLRTSWYGGIVSVDYNGTASAYLCTNAALPAVAANTIGAVDRNSCNPDNQINFIGTRTQWNIRPDFYIGADVVYQQLETSFAGLASYVSSGPRPSSLPQYEIEDQHALSVTLRVHRDILP